MHIATSQIEKYCKKLDREINIQIDLTDKEISFRFVGGSYEMSGGTAVNLFGKEILDLLELNGVLGESAEVNKILNSNETNKDQKIDDLIYTTIAKYVIQMLSAATGKDLAPEIKALPQHAESYFRRLEE